MAGGTPSLAVVAAGALGCAVIGGAIGAGGALLVAGPVEPVTLEGSGRAPAVPVTPGAVPLASPTAESTAESTAKSTVGPFAPATEAFVLPTADDAEVAAIASLNRALDAAAAERSQLAATLVGLSRDIEALEQALGAFNLPMGESAGQAGALAQADGQSASGGEPARGRGVRNGLDVDSLVGAGVDPLVSAELQRRNDAWQLARLELVDRAAREGWEDSDELDRQLDQLGEERPDLREELGDDRYDAYLYESGRPNRISVASVIPGSAAEVAGLRAGDLVFGYAGERLFDVRSLQRASRAGSLGETVTLEARRDGQSLSLPIPRGPLGVSLSPLRREP